MDRRRRLAQFKDTRSPVSPDGDECGTRGTGRVLKDGPVVCGLGGWRGGCSVLCSAPLAHSADTVLDVCVVVLPLRLVRQIYALSYILVVCFCVLEVQRPVRLACSMFVSKLERLSSVSWSTIPRRSKTYNNNY